MVSTINKKFHFKNIKRLGFTMEMQGLSGTIQTAPKTTGTTTTTSTSNNNNGSSRFFHNFWQPLTSL
jgi:hypothetical protein